MMLMMVAALGVALSGQSPDAPKQPTPAQFADARRVLEDRLFDYPAARFRTVRANDFMICGEVNAKNRLGAFTGWKRFGVSFNEGVSTLYSDGGGAADDIMLDALCSEPERLGPADYSERLTHR